MKLRKFTATRVFLAVFFGISVVLPVCTMFYKLTEIDLIKFFSDPKFPKAVVNSLTVSATATFFSILLAFILAWCITRTNIKFKPLFSSLILLPMLIPSMSHGMGLLILFGNNGQLTNLFHLNQTIYGFWGIVLGSIMYSLPVAYLMISDILKYEDSTPYEAAQVLGIPKRKRFMSITLPYVRKPMISVIFATFTLIVTDYGVPTMIGGKFYTLPVMMYNEVIGRMNLPKGCVIGAVLLIPAVIAFIFDFTSRNVTTSSFVPKPFEIKNSKIRDIAAYIFITAVTISLVYPIINFAAITFASDYPRDLSFTLKNVIGTFDKGAAGYLLNSVIISVAVAVIGVIVAFSCAYMTSRIDSPSSKVLHLVSILSLAIPGLVLGLSYVLLFKGSFIYGTIAILILVNMIHFFASPYLMIYNTLGKLNMNLEDVGITLGINRLRVIKDVIIPQSKTTMIEMFSYFFINSMITISAVSFLANTANKPISLMITQFQQEMLIEASAFVSLLILIVNLLMKAVSYIVRYKFSRKEIKIYADKKTV